MLKRLQVIAALTMFVAASPAAASPLLWQYTGNATFNGTSSIIPQATPVGMDWWFDPDAPEQPGCYGYYPTATSSITFHLLGESFTAPGVYTYVNAGGYSIGCGPFPSGLELVLAGGNPYWTDASPTLLGHEVNVQGYASYAGGMGGSYGGWGGPGLPTAPPLFLHFDGPTFIFPLGPQGFPYEWQSMHVDLHPVPEPALLLLMPLGIAGAALRKRRRRATQRE